MIGISVVISTVFSEYLSAKGDPLISYTFKKPENLARGLRQALLAFLGS